MPHLMRSVSDASVRPPTPHRSAAATHPVPATAGASLSDIYLTRIPCVPCAPDTQSKRCSLTFLHVM